jgi:hypothetical protein
MLEHPKSVLLRNGRNLNLNLNLVLLRGCELAMYGSWIRAA